MPLFPVILKPKCTTQNSEHDHFTMQNVQPCLQIYISIKTNIPNVQYINIFEFLVKELELRIELEHLISIFEFAQAFNENMEQGLTSSHQIFADPTLTTELEVSHFVSNRAASQVHQLNESQKTTGQNAKPKKQVHFSESIHGGIEEELKGQDLDNLVQDEEEDFEDEDEEQKKQLTTWRSQLITDNQDTVYIERFKGSPLSIEVTIFKQTRADDVKVDRNRSQIVDILSNLGF